MVQRSPRERWYLYSDDVALADHWLRCDLAQAEIASERAWLLKHWPSLGGFDSTEQWLLDLEPGFLHEYHGKRRGSAYFSTEEIPTPGEPWCRLNGLWNSRRFVSS